MENRVSYNNEKNNQYSHILYNKDSVIHDISKAVTAEI